MLCIFFLILLIPIIPAGSASAEIPIQHNITSNVPLSACRLDDVDALWREVREGFSASDVARISHALGSLPRDVEAAQREKRQRDRADGKNSSGKASAGIASSEVDIEELWGLRSGWSFPSEESAIQRERNAMFECGACGEFSDRLHTPKGVRRPPRLTSVVSCSI